MTRTANAPALVVLAAGIGKRYGDDKQVSGVGPHGEWLLEYAIHDALAAGFRKIVMVIRAPLREALREHLAPHLQGRADLHLVEQSPDNVPAGCHAPGERRKPLGTGHALWCCKPLLQGPFAVINADDYYGRDAFRLLADHFRDGSGPLMVGYRLDQALSPHGSVNRGVCDVDAEGCLRNVVEFIDIRARDGRLHGWSPEDKDTILAPDTMVSLNCWGLLPGLLPDLESGLVEFLRHAGQDDEYFLPHAIDRHLASSGQRLAVLRGDGEWLGLTWPDDRAHVVARMAALHAAGMYPSPLWPTA